MAGGAEVGSAHVSIFPVMTGFRSAVSKEMQSSGKTGAGLFSKAFDGRKLGGDLGKDVSKAFDSQTDMMGDAGFKKLTQQASQASQQLVKARQAQRSAATQAEAAEMKLSEAIEKYGADSVQAVTAQAKLAAAQEKSETATENLTQATEKLTQARKQVFDVAAESGDSGLKWLQTETENATTAMAMARKRLEDADESVTKAERNLAQVIAKTGEGSEQAARAQARLVSAKERQQRASQKAEDAEQRLTQAQKQLETATKNASDSLENGSRSGGIFAKGLQKAEQAVDQLKNKLGSIKDEIKGTLGENLTGALGIAAIGAAISAAIGESIQSGIERINLEGTLKAKLGDTGMAAEAAQVAGQVYAAGWGESLDQIGDDVSLLMQQLGRIDESADFTTLTQQAEALASTFDQDVGGMAAAAGQMIKTGLADNAQQAFDILTVGFQSGADMGQDLLDTFVEYPAQFEKLGLSGEQAMGLISQGLQNGARNADLVADAIKEFSIRAVDGSDTTRQGFELLGLSADEMAAKFGQGGDVAADAFDLVLDRLRNIEDPVERSAAAVDLFGTQAEDLGNALYSLDPSSAVEALGQVDGAAQKAAGNAASITQSFESIKRTLSMGMGAAFTPAIQGVSAALQGAMPVIQSVIQGFTDSIGGIVTTIGNVFSTIGAQLNAGGFMTVLTSLQTLFGQIGASVMPVLTQLGTLLGTVIAGALNMLAPMINTIVQGASMIISAILPPLTSLLTAIIPVITSVVGTVTQAVIPVIENMGGAIQGIIQIIQGVIDFLVGAFTGNWQQAWDAIKTIGDGAWQAIGNIVNAGINAVKGVIDSVLGVIKNLWEAAWGVVRQFVGDAWNNIKTTVDDKINGIKSAIDDKLNAIKNVWNTAWNTVKTTLSDAWNGMLSNARNLGNQLTSFIQSIPDKIKNTFNNAGNWLKSAGRNIIQGLINGITGAVSGAISAVKNAVSGIISGAKNMLGIHSPSTVFRDQIGQMIPAGLAIGVDRNSGTAIDSVRSLADGISEVPFDLPSATRNATTAATPTRSAAYALADGTDLASIITAAIISALAQVGGFQLKVDMRTLAMILAPLIGREQDRMTRLGR